MPERPYLVVGQQSLIDRSRAPADRHTLYCYSHVPSQPARGWDAERECFADLVEARIEQLAPGFRQTVLARQIQTPTDLERENANLVGGVRDGLRNFCCVISPHVGRLVVRAPAKARRLPTSRRWQLACCGEPEWNSNCGPARSVHGRSRLRTPSSSATGFSVISIVVGLVF